MDSFPANLEGARSDLLAAPAEAVLAWGVATFGVGVMLANSFGAEDVVLTHMLAATPGRARSFWLDTEFLFADTHATRRRLEERYPSVEFERVPASLSAGEQERRHGAELWRRDPDLCCAVRKVTPLAGTLAGLDAWITGIRRAQAPTRAAVETVEWDTTFGLVKLNPLAHWSDEQVWAYIHQHDIPFNPMHQRGYPSIGCTHCTRPVKPGEDPRAGRWSGLDKTECGLHRGTAEAS